MSLLGDTKRKDTTATSPPPRPFQWSYLAVTAIATLAISITIVMNSSFDLCEIFYYFLVAPIIALGLIVFAIWTRNKSMAAATVLYCCLAALAYQFSYEMRIHIRWFLQSNYFKSEVMKQQAPPPHQLRHIDWDGWGFSFAENNVYLVFDPDNSLEAVAKDESTGKFHGLPCEVRRVYRLESYWYAAQFYTDSSWDHCLP
jgi:hypothetical protein